MAVLMVVGNVPKVASSIFDPAYPIPALRERQLFALKQDYTIVFVTHTLCQAKRLADHVIFLYLGQLVEQRPTEIIFTNPSDPRTKAYIEGAFG